VKRVVGAVGLVFCFSGCLGYTIGPIKPNYLSNVHTIAVPVFKNETLIPRIEVLVTDTVIKQFQQDGTYKIGTQGNSDATLKAEISRVSRSPARSERGNVLSTSEFNLVMRVKYRLVGPDGKVIGAPGEVTGTTSFFRTIENAPNDPSDTISGDVVTEERQALPLAAEELANHLVTQLSEGW
jgi:lipopolysaccharide assembly LptE-like protein